MPGTISGESGRPLATWQILLILILPLLGFWTTGLLDLDEGFYGAVTGEMLYRREWITPYFNGSPWFEKPILLYWAAMPTVALFGENVGPRLPSVLANLGLYWLIFKETRRYLGEFAATLTSVALATSLLVALLGRLMMTDAILTLCLSLAFLMFYRSVQSGSMTDRWIAATALGISVLAKGPVGGALFIILFGVTYWKEPELREKFKGGWLIGIACFALMVSSWYVPAYLANRDAFVQEFIIRQNIGRFTGGDAAHTITAFWGYFFYIPLIFLGAMPWSLTFFKKFPAPSDPKEAQFLRFCWRWFWTIFLFFSISKAKLPHYIYPLFPPLAMIVGYKLRQIWTERGHVGFDLRVARAGIVTSAIVSAMFVFLLGEYYWQGSLVGNPIANPQGEAHRLIQLTRGKQEPIIAYQLSRRKKSLGTPSKLEETSLPSLTFYAQRPILTRETFTDLPDAPRFVIFTRQSRLGPQFLSDLDQAGLKAVPIQLDFAPKHYTVLEAIREDTATTP